jgi:ABC-type lipoprotein export system ATPase subunit
MKNIKSLEIKNSPFFEDFKLQFDKKMNCIMGGRGTGKSTLLYFLKSALSLESQNNILRNNLGLGEIIVEVEAQDGSLYRIVKTIDEEPQPYKLPNQEFISLVRIINEIECDFYETNQIEQIGKLPLERLALIDKKIKDRLYDYAKLISRVQIDLESNAQDIKTANFRINQIKDSLSQYGNINEEINEFKKNEPLDIKPQEKQEFENADDNEKKRTDEKRFYNKASMLYNDLQNQITLFNNDLVENFSSAILNSENFLNVGIVNKDIDDLKSNNKKITEKLKEISELLYSNTQLISKNYNEIIKIHEKQQAEFVSLKQKFDKNRDYFNRYNILTNRLKEKETLENEISERILKKNRLIEERKYILEKFNSLKNEIFSLRLNAVQEINDILGGDVKITLKFSGITTEFEERLKDALRGSGLKYNDLVYKITETLKPDQFASIVNNKDVDKLHILSGIDENRSLIIINTLHESDEIYKIESIYCDDLPDFKLKIEGDTIRENYRNSDELSMGQRCTTVLPIIFAVSENPLVIDQPEDNLDNKYISEKIHEIIKNQKENRQLIFITHNPNIPVLADSEYNLFLNYENKKSSILKDGNVENVKDEILKILEGGENAFKTRKEKYDIDYGV